MGNIQIGSRLSIDNKRFYVCGEHNYPSVTTVLSSTKSAKDGAILKRWRDKVGCQEANRVSREATDRGTKIHALAEKFLIGLEPVDTSELSQSELPFWESILPALVPIRHIWTEKFLFHDRLQYAGTADCYGVVNGLRTLIDFKTSSKPKQDSWMQDYQMQLVAYSGALWNQYQQPVEQGLIIVALADQPAQQFFYTKREMLGFWDKWIERLNQFYGRF